ncbi:hypothetical protein ElyMa_003000400 [Elysia marginata]|uniref:Death domain-containing protein n=1 Tax=Elysia marginata TaxID=1093978 RepID=A0AAV4IC90_9GAST|nr:hypothetical protein ElyMa_003000400 [Elysia marginata]
MLGRDEQVQELQPYLLECALRLLLEFPHLDKESLEHVADASSRILSVMDDPWKTTTDFATAKGCISKLKDYFKGSSETPEKLQRPIRDFIGDMRKGLAKRGLIEEFAFEFHDLAMAVAKSKMKFDGFTKDCFNYSIFFFKDIPEESLTKKTELFKDLVLKFHEGLNQVGMDYMEEYPLRVADALKKMYPKNKQHANLWLELLVPVLKLPCVDAMDAAYTIVDTTKGMEWKGKSDLADKVFKAAEVVEIPEFKDITEEEKRKKKQENFVKYFKYFLKSFMEGLTRAKIVTDFGVRALRLCTNLLKMSKDFPEFEGLQGLVEDVSEKITVNVKDPESKKAMVDTMKAVCEMCKNPDYPWVDCWYFERAIKELIRSCVRAVDDPRVLTDADLVTYISVCEEALRHDVLNPETGEFSSQHYTVFMEVMDGLSKWLRALDKYNLAVNLFGQIMTTYDTEEPLVYSLNSRYMSDASEAASGMKMLVVHIDKLFELMVETENADLIRTMMQVYPANPKSIGKHMAGVMDVFVKSFDDSSIQYLTMMLTTATKSAPGVFTKENTKQILDKSTENPNSQSSSLQVVQELCKRRPELMVPHVSILMDKSRWQSNLRSWIHDMIATLALYDEKLAPKALDFMSEEMQRQFEEQQENIAGLVGKVDEIQDNVAEMKNDIDRQGQDLDTVKKDVNLHGQRLDQVEETVDETVAKVEEIDQKTLSHSPYWSRDVAKLLNPKADHDWTLLSSRLGYSNDDIRAWAQQADPCMAMLNEWYATRKTSEATLAILTQLQEMNRQDAAVIVENAMKNAEAVVEDEEFEYASPPPIFISYQWGHQPEARLLQKHLEMAGYQCWLDLGQMGGGDKLFEKIDSGIRAAKVVISCVTEKYAKSPNCNREVNLSVNLNKVMIPLLMEKCTWPPPGSMGPIFSEYLFIRFYQRGGEELPDERYWPKDKFQELLMQLDVNGLPPDETQIEPGRECDLYANDESEQMSWNGVKSQELIDKLNQHVPMLDQPTSSSAASNNTGGHLQLRDKTGTQPNNNEGQVEKRNAKVSEVNKNSEEVKPPVRNDTKEKDNSINESENQKPLSAKSYVDDKNKLRQEKNKETKGIKAIQAENFTKADKLTAEEKQAPAFANRKNERTKEIEKADKNSSNEENLKSFNFNDSSARENGKIKTVGKDNKERKNSYAKEQEQRKMELKKEDERKQYQKKWEEEKEKLSKQKELLKEEERKSNVEKRRMERRKEFEKQQKVGEGNVADSNELKAGAGRQGDDTVTRNSSETSRAISRTTKDKQKQEKERKPLPPPSQSAVVKERNYPPYTSATPVFEKSKKSQTKSEDTKSTSNSNESECKDYSEQSSPTPRSVPQTPKEVGREKSKTVQLTGSSHLPKDSRKPLNRSPKPPPSQQGKKSGFHSFSYPALKKGNEIP